MLVYLLWLCLPSFVALQKTTTFTVCRTPTIEIYYRVCDVITKPTFSIEPCVNSKNEAFNISLTWIPTTDLHRLSITIDIWHQSMKVSETRMEICTGDYDEYDLCGALKGETVRFRTEQSFAKFPLVKGTFIVNANIYAGEQEEPVLCGTATLVLK